MSITDYIYMYMRYGLFCYFIHCIYLYKMSRIIDDKTRPYGKKTISKYDKETILIVLKKMILANDFESSLYFATELHASGNFEDIWRVLLDIVVEQIHILNFRLPVFLYTKYQRYDYFTKQFKGSQKIEIRNVAEMREDLFYIIRILTYSPKEELKRYIPKSYYSVNEDSYDILGNVFSEKYVPEMSILREVTDARSNDVDRAITHFKKSLIRIIKSNALYDRMREKETLFFWLSRIISNSYQSSNIVGYPNNVSLYTEYNENDYEQFAMKLWNIIILSSKVNKETFRQVGALYKLFTFCSKNKKCDPTYLNRFLIISLLYLTDRPKSDNVILNKLFEKTNHKSIHRLYANIKDAVSNGTERIDYIEVKRKIDKYKKTKQSRKKRGSRRKKKEELMDERLRIDPIVEENEIEKEIEFASKMETHFNTIEPEQLPNIQNIEERDRELAIVDIEQKELERKEEIRKQQEFEKEILKERDELYEKELHTPNNNKRELSFFKDDTLPEMFRFLPYADDHISEEEEIKSPAPNVLNYFQSNSPKEDSMKSIITSNTKRKKRELHYDIHKV